MRKKREPNYKKIYTDLIKKWYPDRMDECENFLKKERLEVLDVIALNEILFKQTKEINEINQKYRSYDEDTIKQILNYQVKQGLNNTQLANHFKISRNTIASWKKKLDVQNHNLPINNL